jgi:hypothetical protein
MLTNVDSTDRILERRFDSLFGQLQQYAQQGGSLSQEEVEEWVNLMSQVKIVSTIQGQYDNLSHDLAKGAIEAIR